MFREADQLAKLRVVVQAVEIGIISRPIPIADPAAKALLIVSRASAFFPRTP